MRFRRLAVTAFVGIGTAALVAGHVRATDFDGPRQGQGLNAETIGAIDLGPEIEGMDGRTLRLRHWTVEPGGIVPVHSHTNRPAMIYFLEGELIEHRSDTTEPKLHGPGSVSIEALGVAHWWENQGDVPVKMIAVDIFQEAM